MPEPIIMSAQEKMLLAPLLIGMAIQGVLCLFIGMRVLLAKRPVVISNRSLGYLAIIIVLFIVLFACMQKDFSQASLFLALSSIIFLGSYRYVVFGINDSALHESLIAVLNKIAISFKEEVAGLIIPERNLKLTVKRSRYVAQTIGVKSLSATGLKQWVENKEDIAWLKMMARELKNHYATVPIQTTFLNRLPFCIGVLGFGFMALYASLVFGNIVLHAR